MRRSRRRRSHGVPSFAVLVDGKTEEWYLNMLKRHERSIRVSIKPEIPHKKSLKDQFNQIKELSGREYAKVFWIVDLDTLIKESNEVPRGNESPLQKFNKYRQSLKDDFQNVIVIVNNPCLEFWFLLHFENTSRYFRQCAQAVSGLKNHISDYEKTKKYFTRKNNDIYIKLKENLNMAINNANLLGQYDPAYPEKAMCEMEYLFLADEIKDHFL